MDFNALSKQLLTIALLIFLTACSDEEGGEVGAAEGEKDSRIVISASDKIIVPNVMQYQLPIVVQVADSDGSPQANTEVKIILTTTGYYKGNYSYQDTKLPLDGEPDQWAVLTSSALCPAEDINNNLIMDTGEDTNGNGLLEPETPTLTAHPSESPTLIPGTSTLITDSNGFGYLTITYPKSEAHWVRIRLIATTQAGLPENMDVYEINLPVSVTDLEKPGNEAPAFVNSPYGYTADCTSTN